MTESTPTVVYRKKDRAPQESGFRLSHARESEIRSANVAVTGEEARVEQASVRELPLERPLGKPKLCTTSGGNLLEDLRQSSATESDIYQTKVPTAHPPAIDAAL